VCAGIITRLHPYTLHKHLPRLWNSFERRRVRCSTHRGRYQIDSEQFGSLRSPLAQLCLSQVLKHLREAELCGGNSSLLLDWLENLYQKGRRSPGLGRHAGVGAVTKYFAGLGAVLDCAGVLGSSLELFELMANFVVKNGRELFYTLGVEQFLRYVHALDRMGYALSAVLASVLSSIGSEGRRRIRYRNYLAGSVYHYLSAHTKTALRTLDNAKRQRALAGGRTLMPYAATWPAAEVVRARASPPSSLWPSSSWPSSSSSSSSSLLQSPCLAITRSQAAMLRRRFGSRVIIHELPDKYVCCRILKYPPSRHHHHLLHGGRHHLHPHHHHHHHHHHGGDVGGAAGGGRRRRMWFGEPVAPAVDLELVSAASDEDDEYCCGAADYDDTASTLTTSVCDGDGGAEHGIGCECRDCSGHHFHHFHHRHHGHHHHHHHHHGRLSRRVSFDDAMGDPAFPDPYDEAAGLDEGGDDDEFLGYDDHAPPIFPGRRFSWSY
jgi:hypothetical protein